MTMSPASLFVVFNGESQSQLLTSPDPARRPNCFSVRPTSPHPRPAAPAIPSCRPRPALAASARPRLIPALRPLRSPAVALASSYRLRPTLPHPRPAIHESMTLWTNAALLRFLPLPSFMKWGTSPNPHFLHRTHRNAAFLPLPVRKSSSESVAGGGAFIQDQGEEVVEEEQSAFPADGGTEEDPLLSSPSSLVVEAALLSRINQLEGKLKHVEPHVVASLEILPNRMTADALKQLRISKQILVELCSQAGELNQILLAILEDPHEIRRITIMGKFWIVPRKSNMDRLIAEEEEEEIEILLENYLLRCDYCHYKAKRLVDSAKELEDSVAVYSRLEESRVKLLLRVGTTSAAVAGLVARILGMNFLAWVFWHFATRILIGVVAVVYFYVKNRRIL